METVAALLAGFYRLCGISPEDEALMQHGEGEHEVAYEYLTRGAHAAQLVMLDAGYRGWYRRAPLSWQGSELTDGGRYADLPDDFLRAWGDEHRSTIEQPDGTPWGHEILEEEARARRGNFYYFRHGGQDGGHERIWITRDAQPPTNAMLVYHYAHPPFRNGQGEVLDDAEIDFPLRLRALIPAEAAVLAMEEAWFPHPEDQRAAIERAVTKERRRAQQFARMSRRPRAFRRPPRWGNHW